MNIHDIAPYVIGLAPFLVPHLSDLLTERLPSRQRDLVPVAIGAGLGILGRALGMSEQESLLLAGSGPGAAVWHRFVRGGGKIKKVEGPGTIVHPATLPPKT